MWSAPSKLGYGWTFFTAVLVGLVAVIFVGSFETARVVYTACSLSLLAYRVSYYAERGLLLYCVDLCYWVHLVGLAALWLAELPSEWALAGLASAVGPVGGAVFMLQSPLLLHHPEAFESFFLHVVPTWVAYVVRWRLMPPLAPELLAVRHTIRLGFTSVYLPWAAAYLLFLLAMPYTPLAQYETLFDWYTSSVAGGGGGGGGGGSDPPSGARGFVRYAWKPIAYIVAHALLSLEGYAAAALCLRWEAVMLAWIAMIFACNILYAFDFYRASADPAYRPGNKLVAGLRDSAISWAVMLPLWYCCEQGYL